MRQAEAGTWGDQEFERSSFALVVLGSRTHLPLLNFRLVLLPRSMAEIGEKVQLPVIPKRNLLACPLKLKAAATGKDNV
jgi:hypothetical protein